MVEKYKYTYNKKDLLTTNFTGTVPSLDCSNIITDGIVTYICSGVIMSLSLRLVKLYSSSCFKADLAESIVVEFQMQYFNFGIGNRTSICVLDLWFTYNHYLYNGILIVSTAGLESRPCREILYKKCTRIMRALFCVFLCQSIIEIS